MPLLQVIITLLCAVGFYASVFMMRKYLLDARGGLTEPSVVQSPRATLFAGAPNALFGLCYYPALAAIAWLAPSRLFLDLALAAAGLAALTSLYLAYSLIFVTRRSCPYCFTAHAVNLALLAATAWLALAR